MDALYGRRYHGSVLLFFTLFGPPMFLSILNGWIFVLGDWIVSLDGRGFPFLAYVSSADACKFPLLPLAVWLVQVGGYTRMGDFIYYAAVACLEENEKKNIYQPLFFSPS
jgi:hypothetical protein